ncbi:hypothetical protein [Natronobiforma cellulositropha]|uniref:hypothetical protein n=1 Tax=Natronobiforma cellulositropha TaxID=1679076 RepID=UPI0021D5CD98|nr:hypothetical protein [Natronobiforma cellulositropha]
MSADDGPVAGREVAYRLFAAEYDDASLSHAESDEERAPNYVVTPTGARTNRLFVTGTLTEVTPVNDEMVRARVVDPTGAFVVYAGQYQPEALAFLERTDPPAFVAVTGKARTFQPDDSDLVYTSIRPESFSTIDAATRERWVVTAAEQTLERIATYAAAAEVDARGEALTETLLENGVEAGLAAGIPLAQDHYGTTPDYLEALRTLSLEAARVVAGDLDQVGAFSLVPDESSGEGASFASLAADRSFEASHTTTETRAAQTAETEPAEAPAATPGASGEPAATDAADTASDRSSETDDESLESDAPSESVAPSETTAEETAAAEKPASAGADSEPPVEASSADAGDDAATETEPASADADDESEAETDLEDVGGMYEMDDEERAELEAEFGAEFTTGTDVGDPGEAGIETPEPDPADAAAETPATDETSESDDASTDTDDVGGSLGDFEPQSEDLTAQTDDEVETDSSDADADGDEPDATPEAADGDLEDEESDETPADVDVDVESLVVETMRDLDDGDGADRATLIETITADAGVDEAAVEEAIEDALMGGQCYEPDDETLKPI